MAGVKGKSGRKSLHTPALAKEVCRRMALGESLRKICERKGMPGAGAVLGWVSDDRDGFAAQYARARDQQTQHWADELVDIADDDSRDAQTPQAIQRDRLRTDTRKWIASKLLPKKYGDKTTLEHQGKDGGAININISKDDAAHLGLKGEEEE